MAADLQAHILEREREEYREDALKWLHKRFGWITQRINEQQEQQIGEIKSFMQYAAELRLRSLRATEHALTLGVAVIAMIALAAAGLWIGVAGVALFLAAKYWWSFYVEKLSYRLDRFRERFRELLEPATGMGFHASDMLPEDKEFVRKYADSILFPLAVAPEKSYWYSPWNSDAKCLIRGRETVKPSDLEHIETLYREYHGGMGHLHRWPGPNDPNSNEALKCTLCMAARRIKEHFEGAISKLESAIESARHTLITGIDGSSSKTAVCARECLEDYREWEKWQKPEEHPDEKLHPFPLLKSLREKEYWTFEEADKVWELCRNEKMWKEQAKSVLDKLTREMESAATRNGLEQVWELYKWKPWLQETLSNSSPIRRILGRTNPQAMFRELTEWGNSYRLKKALETLKSYGGDRTLVAREVQTAAKFIAKEGGEWDRCYERELRAAQGFALGEGVVSERRYKERLKLS